MRRAIQKNGTADVMGELPGKDKSWERLILRVTGFDGLNSAHRAYTIGTKYRVYETNGA